MDEGEKRRTMKPFKREKERAGWEKILWAAGLFILLIPGLRGEEKGSKSDGDFNPSWKWSGYAQVQYIHSSNSINTFRIRRARLKIKGYVIEAVQYKIQLAATKTPVLLDAQVDIKLSPFANLKFGQYKVPFSLENLTSSSALDTINRSLAVEYLAPGRDVGASGRDVGISVYGQASNIEYTLGLYNGSGKNRWDDNEHKDVGGRLVYSPFRSLSIGISFYQGEFDDGELPSTSTRNRRGIDISFVQDRYSLKSEYIYARDHALEREGLYIQGTYFPLPEEMEIVLRYGVLDKNMHRGGGGHKIMTLGLNWFISERAKFQANFEYHKEEPFPGADKVLLILFQAGF